MLRFLTRPPVSSWLSNKWCWHPLLRPGEAGCTHPVPVSSCVSDFWEGCLSASLIPPPWIPVSFRAEWPFCHLRVPFSFWPHPQSLLLLDFGPISLWILWFLFCSFQILKSLIPSAKFSHPLHSPVPDHKPSQITLIPGGRLLERIPKIWPFPSRQYWTTGLLPRTSSSLHSTLTSQGTTRPLIPFFNRHLSREKVLYSEKSPDVSQRNTDLAPCSVVYQLCLRQVTFTSLNPSLGYILVPWLRANA